MPIDFLFLAGFGKLANELAELLRKLGGGRTRRNNEAAAYFEQLADAMVKVVDGLRANEVPRISGHEMQTLIQAFEKKTKGAFKGDESKTRKASLEQAAATASTLDVGVLFYRPEVDADREKMLTLLERIAGDCRGLAGVLKSAV
jgi:hypothetical protein